MQLASTTELQTNADAYSRSIISSTRQLKYKGWSLAIKTEEVIYMYISIVQFTPFHTLVHTLVYPSLYPNLLIFV